MTVLRVTLSRDSISNERVVLLSGDWITSITHIRLSLTYFLMFAADRWDFVSHRFHRQSSYY